MLNKLLKILQCSALTISLAFLICPDHSWVNAQPASDENSNLFQRLQQEFRELLHEMNDPSLSDFEDENWNELFFFGPDSDGDNIRDKVDVCVDEPYRRKYHEECLTAAGVKLPSLPKLESVTIGAYPRSYVGPRIRIPLVTSWTFQNAAIRTCNDLKSFREKMYRISDRWQDYADLLTAGGIIASIIVAILTLGVGGVITIAVFLVLSLVCSRISRAYGSWGDSADEAYEELQCAARKYRD